MKFLSQIKQALVFSKASYGKYLLLAVSIVAFSVFRPMQAFVYREAVNIAMGVGEGNLNLWLFLGLMAIVIYDVSIFCRNHLRNRLTEEIIENNQSRLLEQILRAPIRITESQSMGEQLTVLKDDIQLTATMVPTQYTDLIFGVLQLSLSLVYALQVSVPLTVVSICVLPLSFIITKVISPKIQEKYQLRQESEARVRTFFLDRMQHLLLIKSFTLQSKLLGSFDTLYSERLVRVSEHEKMQATMSASGSFFGTLATAVVYSFGFYQVSQGRMSIGDLLGYTSILSSLLWPFLMMPRIISTIASQQAAFSRIKAMAATLNSFQETQKTDNCDGELVMTAEGISFSYDGIDNIFSDLSFTFQPGSIVGIAGPSGSGKSTLLKLILGLYQPQHGKLSIQSGEIASEYADMRSYISYVPQGGSLVKGTIAENIRFRNASATTEAVVLAAQMANAHNFIMDLPAQYDTDLGELGSSLSEGQAQRIAIARALLANKPVLVMDEASSALDATSEQFILETIMNVSKDKLCILVAHRQAMLDICTEKLLLGNG